MKASEVLRAALAYHGSNGERWICGASRDSHGRRCMAESVGEASPGYLVNLAADSYIRRAVHVEVYGIWNDEPGRTWPEVRAAYERAIALAEADEAPPPAGKDARDPC